MSEMTLEQVRDELRCLYNTSIRPAWPSLEAWADAIDAHLTRSPVQVTDEDTERLIDIGVSAFDRMKTFDMERRLHYAIGASVKETIESLSARLAQPVVAVQEELDAAKDEVHDLSVELERTRQERDKALAMSWPADAENFAYRHLSLPGVDGERAWGPWQRFGAQMQISAYNVNPSQPHPQAAQVSVSDALNRLEDMAVAGEQMQGDDVWRFRALVDRLAPQAAQGGEAQGEAVAWMKTEREYHEYENSAKVDDVGYLSTKFLTTVPRDPKGWIPLYTHPAERAAVPDGWVLVDRHDLLKLLEANLSAANEAIPLTSGIDFIEDHGGEESDDDMERVAYHLYYGLFAAERLRSSLSAAPTLAGKENS